MPPYSVQQRQGVMRIGKTRVSTRYAYGAAVARKKAPFSKCAIPGAGNKENPIQSKLSLN